MKGVVMPHLAMASAVAIVLLATCACSNEQARHREHEQQRAMRLEQELAAFQSDFSKRSKLELPAQSSANLDRLVPEWKTYDDSLTSCDRLFGEMLDYVATRQASRISTPSLEGFRCSTDVVAMAVGKMRQITDAFDPEKDPGSGPEFSAKAQYYNAVAKLARTYASGFLRVLKTLALNAPDQSRATMFEQLAGLHPKIKPPGLVEPLTGLLQEAWAKEDDPALKARMEQKLRDLSLPLAAPRPESAPMDKGK